MPYPRETDSQLFRFRFLRTERDMQREFMVLTVAHSFSKVTIGMVCKAAHVSRTTFYQHFDDKFVLLERTLILLLSIPEEEISRRSAFPFGEKTFELMKIVAQNCADNRDFLRSVLNDATLPAYRSLMSKAVEAGIDELFRYLTSDVGQSGKLEKYGKVFLSSALFGSLMHWVLEEETSDLDGFCRKITGYISNTLGLSDS